MRLESAIRILAGTFVLLSLALQFLWGPWALAIAAFVGVNLIQSSLTGFCPAETILQRLGVGAGETCAVPARSEAARPEAP